MWTPSALRWVDVVKYLQTTGLRAQQPREVSGDPTIRGERRRSLCHGHSSGHTARPSYSSVEDVADVGRCALHRGSTHASPAPVSSYQLSTMALETVMDAFHKAANQSMFHVDGRRLNFEDIHIPACPALPRAPSPRCNGTQCFFHCFRQADTDTQSPGGPFQRYN